MLTDDKIAFSQSWSPIRDFQFNNVEGDLQLDVLLYTFLRWVVNRAVSAAPAPIPRFRILGVLECPFFEVSCVRCVFVTHDYPSEFLMIKPMMNLHYATDVPSVYQIDSAFEKA